MEIEPQSAPGFPESVRLIRDGERSFYLIGTAHVSKKSVEEVEETIRSLRPDSVVVELCKDRQKALQEGERWKEMDLIKVVRQGKIGVLFAHLLLASWQKKMGEQLGVKPGAEQLVAMEVAEEIGSKLVLGDRSAQITLKRAWAGLGFWGKMKLLAAGLESLFEKQEIKEEDLEELKKHDVLEKELGKLGEEFPSIRKSLIDERDQFLKNSIQNAPGDIVVGVVGAGHVNGIISRWKETVYEDDLIQAPSGGLFWKAIKWIIPLLIMALLGYGFYIGGKDLGIEALQVWVLYNGTLAAMGTLFALGHPLTILTAFIAAPITSLNFFIGAGMVAAPVQLLVRRPKVEDFENILEDLSSFKGMYRNRIGRAFLVFLFCSLGSAAGSFSGIVDIVTRYLVSA